MNERIVLLKHQASVWCDENIPDQFSEETNGYGRAWEEKFAELIVEECVHTAKELYDECKPWGGVEDVLKHFGVEEQEKVAPKPKCSVCGTTENVIYMGGYQPYLCDSVDCIPF